MTENRKSPFDNIQSEIDLRLGGLLGELGSALSEAINRLDANGEGVVHQEKTFDIGNGPIRASAGIRIRPLGAGAASTPSRAPEKPVNAPEPQAPAPRPITATVFDTAESWQLVADLPGIEADGISLSRADGDLIVEARGRGRHYRGSFPMPADANLSDLKTASQNGIVEIRFAKPEPTE
ncbi:MAG: Hsp20/alpha crystallin family protein [Pseudomonadota bacterium]